MIQNLFIIVFFVTVALADNTSEDKPSAVPDQCGCEIQGKFEALRYNSEFIAKHTERLLNDIREREAEQKLTSQRKTRQSWLLNCDNGFLQEKKDALNRLRHYKGKLASFDNMHIILQDLYIDFKAKSCKRQTDCDKFDEESRLEKQYQGKLGPYLELQLRNDCESKKIKSFLQNFSLSKPAKNAVLKERCPGDDPKKEIEGNDETDACISCQIQQSKMQLNPSAVDKWLALKNLNHSIHCSGKLQCANSPQEFLSWIGIKNTEDKLPVKLDLSNIFSRPQLQGKSHACMGFAFAADVEAELYKMSLGGFEIAKPDPWEIYSVMSGQSKGETCDGKVEGRNYNEGVNALQATEKLAYTNTCLKGPNQRFALDGAVILENVEDVDFQFFKKALSRDKTLTVSLSTEIRATYEDWIRPVAATGTPHAVHVVGYGEAVNPMSLKKEPYLLIRDSFHDQSCHMRMSFQDLKRTMKDIVKVKGVTLTSDN